MLSPTDQPYQPLLTTAECFVGKHYCYHRHHPLLPFLPLPLAASDFSLHSVSIHHPPVAPPAVTSALDTTRRPRRSRGPACTADCPTCAHAYRYTLSNPFASPTSRLPQPLADTPAGTVILVWPREGGQRCIFHSPPTSRTCNSRTNTMGQGASQPLRGDHGAPAPAADDGSVQRRRHSSLGNLLRNTEPQPANNEDSGSLLNRPPRRRLPTRSGSINRLSRLLQPSPTSSPSDAGPSRPSTLQRSRTTLSNIFRRHDRTLGDHQPSQSRSILHDRASYAQSPSLNEEEDEYHAPRLPSIDHSSTFEQDFFDPEQGHEQLPRSAGSHRLPNIRFNALRPDRPFRHITSSLRRRRSPPPSAHRRPAGMEDQATMLSRLLSVAAAATAATLMGDDHHALSEARGLSGGTGIGEVGGNGEDGSFDGFLRALQNGRIASALRQGSEGQENGEGGQSGPLNFFRMFRFGASRNAGSENTERPESQSQPTGDGSNNTESRMVPIIIVGIRSISPNSSSGAGGGVDELPPFIDALGHFPSPLPAHALGAHGHDSIDSILRPPQNGTSFRHRRRASMGGLGMGRSRINDRYDDQRDHRSPDRRRERPWSVASSSSTAEPRPPPATPASPSPELSRISSRNTTPSHSRPASFVANSIRDLASDSRRNSALHRSAGSPLASHTEETGSVHSSRSSDNLLSQLRDSELYRGHRRSDTAPNIHYPRFASGHPRRNGVVEPDNLPSLSRSSTGNATEGTSNAINEDRNDSRSWIIYVLGGSYPENHPILTTPSLFTENPTYEDMMLLSTLLGPAKAPVASESDVQSAGGLYEIVVVDSRNEDEAIAVDQPSRLAAVVHPETKGENDPERVSLELGHRCLVCLCDFEAKETARRLVKCGHVFHKECIDHVSFLPIHFLSTES